MTVDWPTADDVATAITAAAREVNPEGWREDAIAIAGRFTAQRGRHYAMHALAYVFPHTDRAKLAEWCGAPGKAVYFWKNSCNQVANPTGHSSWSGVHWWRAETFMRIVTAIEASRTARAVGAPAPKIHPVVPKPAPRMVAPAARPEPLTIERVLDGIADERPVFDRAGTFKERKPAPLIAPTGKGDLQRMLAEAAANTAAQQARDRGEEA